MGVDKGTKRLSTNTVLVIEDDELNSVLFRSLLESRDYEVRCVRDGTTAIAELTSTRPHLVVLDMVIPGTPGFEVLETVKKSEDLRRIPVVVVSAVPPANHRRAILDAGCDAFIEKPMSVNTFLSTVAHLLKRQRKPTVFAAGLARCLEQPPPAAMEAPRDPAQGAPGCGKEEESFSLQ